MTRCGWIAVGLAIALVGCGGSSSVGTSGGTTAGTTASDSDPIADVGSPSLTSAMVSEFASPAGANGVSLCALSPDGNVVSEQKGLGPGSTATALSTVTGAEITLPDSVLTGVSVIFSLSQDGSAFGYAKWTESGGLPAIYSEADGIKTATLPQWTYLTEVRAISADGKTIGGLCYDPINRDVPFVWSEATGFRALPLGNLYEADVTALSDDGRVAVGGARLARRWVDAGQPQNVGPTGYRYSYALDVSADGNAVVGYVVGGNPEGSTAYRWTAEGGPKRLGHYPGFANSKAVRISADGKVVVGEVWGPAPATPFVWTSASGMKLLRDLVSGGSPVLLNPDGPVRVVDLSADGHTVIGGTYANTGYFPEHAWVARVGW